MSDVEGRGGEKGCNPFPSFMCRNICYVCVHTQMRRHTYIGRSALRTRTGRLWHTFHARHHLITVLFFPCLINRNPNGVYRPRRREKTTEFIHPSPSHTYETIVANLNRIVRSAQKKHKENERALVEYWSRMEARFWRWKQIPKAQHVACYFLPLVKTHPG